MLFSAIILGLFLNPSKAHAQIAGSSFNTSALCVNPAASVERPFGSFTMPYGYKNSKSEVTQERVDFLTVPWVEKIEYHKAEMIFTHVRKRFTLEAYLSYDNVKKTTTLDGTFGGSNQANSNAASFVNNMANLGIRLNDKVGIGVKYFSPAFALKYDNTFTYYDGKTTRDASDYKGIFSGLGFGVLAEIKTNVTFAAYVIRTKQDVKGTSSYTDSNGTNSTFSSDGTASFETKGAGIGYMDGSLRHDGKRFEIGYSRMDAFFGGGTKPGEQIFAAAEMAIRGIAFGGNVRLIKNGFVDNMNLVEAFIEPPTAEDQFTPRFDSFLTLSSTKGHGFGLSGSYWVSKGQKSFLGVTQPAKTTSYSAGVSYSYLF